SRCHSEPGSGRGRVAKLAKFGSASALSSAALNVSSCPLYPQKPTSLSAIAMSALCQKRTFHSISSSVWNNDEGVWVGSLEARKGGIDFADWVQTWVHLGFSPAHQRNRVELP